MAIVASAITAGWQRSWSSARDDLLDDNDDLVGRVKDVKEVEKRLRHKLRPQNSWRLVPFFDLFMSAPKDELHQWYVHRCQWYMQLYTSDVSEVVQKGCKTIRAYNYISGL